MPKTLITFGTLVLLGVAFVPPAHAGDITGKVTAKKKKYLKGTVVYLKQVPGKHNPPAKPVPMDQKNQTFIPFVLPIVKGTTVRFLNNDNTGHNVFTPDGEKYDLGTWPKGQTRSYTFKKEGVYTQLCKMHPSMLAYVISLQNPYFAVVEKDGSFAIKGAPAGSYQLAVWNERKKAKPQSVAVPASGAVNVDLKLGR